MGRLFFISLLFSLSLVSIARPWIGIVAAYGLVLLTPHAIWYWNFEGLRPAFWLLVPTLIGFVLTLVRGKYLFGTLANSRNAYMLVLWLALTLSYIVGDYVSAGGPYRFSDPSWVLETLNKMLLIYFVGCVCLDDEVKLRAITWVFVCSALYLIYWANDQYLAGRVMGRMPGPVDASGIGTYSDENTFSLLFVVAQPYLWYIGLSSRNLVIRWGLWLAIPFGWHAVFLTASRGGLVGLVVVTLLMTLRSKRRMLGLALVPAFLIAYQWQAGDLMKSRADTIDEYQTDASSATRLDAWAAAIGMIAEHPLTGVGLGSFGPAFPDFSDAHPREAHNTFFQIAAESGLLAGGAYVLLVVGSILALWRNAGRLSKELGGNKGDFLYLVNEATLAALIGLGICALFLSLQLFEIVYYLFLMTNVVLFVSARRRSETSTAVIRHQSNGLEKSGRTGQAPGPRATGRDRVIAGPS